MWVTQYYDPLDWAIYQESKLQDDYDRMAELGIKDYEEYLEHLAELEEAQQLAYYDL